MGLIPPITIRISMAYKLSVIIAFALAMCCFFWDIYTHRSLEETQEALRKEQKNVEILVEYLLLKQEECEDGN